MMTVKELKDLLADVPDDAKVVVFDNYDDKSRWLQPCTEFVQSVDTLYVWGARE